MTPGSNQDLPHGHPMSTIAPAQAACHGTGSTDLAAALLLERGPDAARHALRCAEICLIRGQSHGYAAWRDVLRAIEILEGMDAPPASEESAIDAAFVAGPLDPLLRAHDAAAAER